jgi:chaperone modulatory protein CbpM
MHRNKFISVNEFCLHHEIEISFLHSLQQTGLIKISAVDEAGYLDEDQLQQLEKFVRLYYELDINLEGIETISYLLERVICLQDEIIALKNRLRLYEGDE